MDLVLHHNSIHRKMGNKSANEFTLSNTADINYAAGSAVIEMRSALVQRLLQADWSGRTGDFPPYPKTQSSPPTPLHSMHVEVAGKRAEATTSGSANLDQ